ncbi:hypothetical protein CYMTET_10243 [Cymbomonas tetramitiformis]|uniref:ABC-2 type transporter transmembrane domain-containing protein n=1 Tax=Cymbomonas tetramitiformis TaxID=36881 RepID=A0AAE0GQ19_9CHLO|nr:hypothetical protein CYMTET_10243 [Cymbomonas tetramitiformis]
MRSWDDSDYKLGALMLKGYNISEFLLDVIVGTTLADNCLKGTSVDTRSASTGDMSGASALPFTLDNDDDHVVASTHSSTYDDHGLIDIQIGDDDHDETGAETWKQLNHSNFPRSMLGIDGAEAGPRGHLETIAEVDEVRGSHQPQLDDFYVQSDLAKKNCWEAALAQGDGGTQLCNGGVEGTVEHTATDDTMPNPGGGCGDDVFPGTAEDLSFSKEMYPHSMLREMWILLRYRFRYFKFPAYVACHFLLPAVLGGLLSSIYFDQKHDDIGILNIICVLQIIFVISIMLFGQVTVEQMAIERPVLIRERQDAYFRLSTYTMVWMLHTALVGLLSALMFSCTLYPFIGLREDWGAFVYFVLNWYVAVMIAECIGHALAALLKVSVLYPCHGGIIIQRGCAMDTALL